MVEVDPNILIYIKWKNFNQATNKLKKIKNMSMHETRTFSIIYFFLYDYIYNLIFVINKKQFIFVFVSATSLNTKFSFSVVLSFMQFFHIYVRNIYLSIFLCYAILVAITPSSETKNVQLNEPTISINFDLFLTVLCS
jgi:hypothetical protein